MDTVTHIDASVLPASLIAPGTQPRGWWNLPDAGHCKGMDRQFSLGYFPTIERNAIRIGKRAVDLAVFPSGRNLLVTDHGIRTAKGPSRRDQHRAAVAARRN